jgi:hypothetical protein
MAIDPKVKIPASYSGYSSSDSDDGSGNELGKQVTIINRVALKELEKAIAFHTSPVKNTNGRSPFGTPMDTPGSRANSSGGASSAGEGDGGGAIQFIHEE